MGISSCTASGYFCAAPVLKTFPDGFLPFVGSEVKAIFEELKKEFQIVNLPKENLREAVDIIRKKALRNSLGS